MELEFQDIAWLFHANRSPGKGIWTIARYINLWREKEQVGKEYMPMMNSYQTPKTVDRLKECGLLTATNRVSSTGKALLSEMGADWQEWPITFQYDPKRREVIQTINL